MFIYQNSQCNHIVKASMVNPFLFSYHPALLHRLLPLCLGFCVACCMGEVFLETKNRIISPPFPQADTRSQPRASGSAAKMDQLQSQVNKVKVILTDDISKVLEREDRLLDDLIGKADQIIR